MNRRVTSKQRDRHERYVNSARDHDNKQSHRNHQSSGRHTDNIKYCLYMYKGRILHCDKYTIEKNNQQQYSLKPVYFFRPHTSASSFKSSSSSIFTHFPSAITITRLQFARISCTSSEIIPSSANLCICS